MVRNMQEMGNLDAKIKKIKKISIYKIQFLILLKKESAVINNFSKNVNISPQN